MTTTHKKEKLHDIRNGVITLNRVELKDFKGYNEVTILENINLRVLPGEFVCLLSKDSYEKTKLINIIGGVISPSSGMARIEGKNIAVTRNNDNIISSQSELCAFRTVEGNLLKVLKKRKIPKELSKELVNKYVEKFQLQNIKRKLVWGLSNILRVKVDIARLFINKERIILMDNPFKNLNERERDECQVFIKNIWRTTGKTFIFATENIEEALLLGTRVVIMSSEPGRIVKEYDTEFNEEYISESFKEVKGDENFIELRDEIKMTYF